MQRRYVLALAVLAILSTPRPSFALMEWIWELSGPRMIGTGVYCALDFNREKICDEYGGLVLWQEGQVQKRFWVKGGTSVLRSAGNNPLDSAIYAALFEATFEGRWTTDDLAGDGFMIYSGAGYSYNYFFGSAFENYSNPAWKVTPIAFQWRFSDGWYLKSAFNVRWFDKTFNNADVSNPLPERERVYGAFLGVSTSFGW